MDMNKILALYIMHRLGVRGVEPGGNTQAKSNGITVISSSF